MLAIICATHNSRYSLAKNQASRKTIRCTL